MRAVEVVLEHQFPVAVVGVLEDAARQFELAAGRTIDEVIERRAHWAEKFLERLPARRQRREYEPAVDAHPGHGVQAQLGELARRVARGERRCLQRAAAVVAPAVVRTDEALDIAATFRADHRAAMRAAVDQYFYRAVIMAADDDRFAPHARREVVAARPHLALVAEHQPR